uniref:Uncharacterized protein n=1 Tax=Avena sativa TaxID=4498 RepID=A0ACD5YMS0_AVESA
MDPHIGMRYDTLQGAKEHYNAYAARTGFSIKVNRNRKSGRTNEISKQQFVCNKFRKPRNDDGVGDKPDVVGPIPSSESSDEEDRQNVELASVVAEIAKQKGQKKNSKKRKRETIIPTNCKAEMVVKLKDGRWKVIAFTAGHNHRLVHKPSLNKYLRSHQGKWHAAARHSHFRELYDIKDKWVPCYFLHRVFPFLQSMQRSEGFHAVLKRYVNPHKSLLKFVKQYEKIQVHVLVKEGGNDYSTKFLEVQRWSPYPIEEHVFNVYCRYIYLKFRHEFELISTYNVSHFGGLYYRFEPNRTWCAKYGPRTYVVTTNKDEGIYSCECSKFDRDGMLFCHILKVFTHLGVDVIPKRYILKRWTPQAVSGGHEAEVVEQPDVMPPQLQQQVRHANLNMSFQKLARVSCTMDAATAIVNKHMRAAAAKITQMNKSRKKKKKPAAEPSASAPVDPTIPRDPPKSTTKKGERRHIGQNLPLNFIQNRKTSAGRVVRLSTILQHV